MSTATSLGSLLLAAGIAAAPLGSVVHQLERSPGFVTSTTARPAPARPTPGAPPKPVPPRHAPSKPSPRKSAPPKPAPRKAARPKPVPPARKAGVSAPGRPIRVGEDVLGALFLGLLLSLAFGGEKKA